MKHNVFFSYKSEYENIVSAITEILERDGIPCWYAPRNLDNGTAGNDYDDSIVEAINATDIVVVLLCDEALKSSWVKREVTQAEENQKMIIPFVIEALSIDNGLRLRLKDKHWIYSYPNPEKKFDILEHNIQVALNQKSNTSSKVSHIAPKQFEFDSTLNDIDYEEGKVLYEAKEYIDAIYSLLSSAEHGNPKAKSLLCQIFYKMENPDIPNEVWEIIQSMADKGQSFANFIMSTKDYRNPSNFIISFDYLRKAIRSNEQPLAVLRTGIYHRWGMGTKQNTVLAHHYYQKAIEMGCPEAYRFMGQLYEYGSDKIEEDKDKAEEYYLKGAEKGESFALKSLITLYFQPGIKQDFEKAQEWAQKMIDQEIPEGYELMGTVCLAKNNWNFNEQTMNYYKEAAQRDVKSAYGDLAGMYWNNNDHQKAYTYAKRGAQLKDSSSCFSLAFFYEQDENFEEAWKYYMSHYALTSSGSEDLGRLYLEKGYKPEQYGINDLVHLLENGARTSSEKSLDYLIQLYSEEKFNMQDKDKVISWIKFGASLNEPQYLFEYGKILLDQESLYFNAFKGLNLMMESVEKGYKEAITDLTAYLHKEEYKDEKRLHRIYMLCFKYEICQEEYAEEQTEAGLSADTEEEQQWVNHFIVEFVNQLGRGNGKYHRILYQLLSTHFKSGSILKEKEVEELTEMAKSCIKNKDHSRTFLPIVSRIVPELDLSLAEKTGGKQGFDDYYAFVWQGTDENDVKLVDYNLEMLYQPFLSDKSYEMLDEHYDCHLMGIDRFWEKYGPELIESYTDACERYDIPSRKLTPLQKRDILPFFSSYRASELKKELVSLFLDFFLSSSMKMKKIFQLNKTDDHYINDILDILDDNEEEEITSFIINFLETIINLDTVIADNFNIYSLYNNKEDKKIEDLFKDYVVKLRNAKIETDLKEEFFDDYIEKIRTDSEIEAEMDEFDNDDSDN